MTGTTSIHGRSAVSMVDGVGASSAEPATGMATPGTSLLPPAQHAFASLDACDVGAALAKLMVDQGAASEKAKRATRQVEEATQRAEEENQLRAMQKQADAKLAAGVVAGASTVASAAFTFASASSLDGVEPKPAAKAFDGGAKAVSGAGNAASACLESAASARERDAVAAEHAAARARRSADDARDGVADGAKLIDRALDLYHEYQQGKLEAQRAALFRA